MSSKDVVIKVIIIILMILGTTFFILSEKKINYKKIRKFLIINSFAYSGLLSMIGYLAGVPGRFWALTIYASVLFVSEVLLMKIK